MPYVPADDAECLIVSDTALAAGPHSAEAAAGFWRIFIDLEVVLSRSLGDSAVEFSATWIDPVTRLQKGAHWKGRLSEIACPAIAARQLAFDVCGVGKDLYEDHRQCPAISITLNIDAYGIRQQETVQLSASDHTRLVVWRIQADQSVLYTSSRISLYDPTDLWDMQVVDESIEDGDVSADESISEETPFRLLDLPNEVLKCIVAAVAAAERRQDSLLGDPTASGWTGGFAPSNMPNTVALALTCRRLSALATEQLWQALDCSFSADNAETRSDSLTSASLSVLLQDRKARGLTLPRCFTFHASSLLKLVDEWATMPSATEALLQSMRSVLTLVRPVALELNLLLGPGAVAEVIDHLWATELDLRVFVWTTEVHFDMASPNWNAVWVQKMQPFLHSQRHLERIKLIFWPLQRHLKSVKLGSEAHFNANFLSLPDLRCVELSVLYKVSVDELMTAHVHALQRLVLHEIDVHWLCQSLLPLCASTLNTLELSFNPARTLFDDDVRAPTLTALRHLEISMRGENRNLVHSMHSVCRCFSASNATHLRLSYWSAPAYWAQQGDDGLHNLERLACDLADLVLAKGAFARLDTINVQLQDWKMHRTQTQVPALSPGHRRLLLSALAARGIALHLECKGIPEDLAIFEQRTTSDDETFSDDSDYQASESEDSGSSEDEEASA